MKNMTLTPVQQNLVHLALTLMQSTAQSIPFTQKEIAVVLALFPQVKK